MIAKQRNALALRLFQSYMLKVKITLSNTADMALHKAFHLTLHTIPAKA
jgi:hypothetical protein